ncbi:MAG: sulfotransferase [Gemmatimonadota bacterium]
MTLRRADARTPQPDRPIVIVGAARSGTTLVGELIARHPAVAYWVEPKYVWQYGVPGAAHDLRTAAEATPEVRAYIRRRFAAYARRRGRPRFAEKTPSNCFRIPFVDAVLPDARYIHVIRDGRDAVFSALGKWTSPPASDAVWRRLTGFEVPLRDLPVYLLQAASRAFRSPWTRPEWEIWGPRYPGIREDRARRPLLEVCALQWRASVQALRRDLASIPPERVTEVRYEELVRNPEGEVARILHGVELEPDDGVAAFAAAHAHPRSVGRWRKRTPEELDRVLPILAAELEAWGYA